MKDNKNYAKQQYKCGLCGSIYDTISERSECEIKCLKKQAEEEKKAAEEKKKKEQEARLKEVDEAVNNTCKLIEKYIEDYGAYNYKPKYKDSLLSDPIFHAFYHFLP